MAKLCTFCGCELPRFGVQYITCCSTTQPACKSCCDSLTGLSNQEIGHRALATGRARYADVIRNFLDRMEADTLKHEAARHTDKSCLRCGTPMTRIGPHQFQLGEHTFFLGDLSHLVSGSLTLELLYCEHCRKVEFFLPDDIPLP